MREGWMRKVELGGNPDPLKRLPGAILVVFAGMVMVLLSVFMVLVVFLLWRLG